VTFHHDRRRAGSFGADAERYDRARPDYPAALYEDLVAGGPRLVLDVGCGTGKLGGPLVERGCRVVGVEPDPRMAAVARRRGIEVEVAAFEAWEPAGRRFDLLVAGQSWHWIDPEAGAARAAEALRPGGRLALVWNVGRHDDRTADAFDAVYARLAPHLVGSAPRPGTPSGDELRPYADALVATGAFDRPEERSYPWRRTYTTAEWLDQLGTHSDHRVLPDEQRQALHAAVGVAADRLGGTVPMTYDCVVLATSRR
jgi:SAM-dependent methyltransferase